jgi:hypothetical protein
VRYIAAGFFQIPDLLVNHRAAGLRFHRLF